MMNRNVLCAILVLVTCRELVALGNILTYAGTGQQGFSGDGGPATQGRLDNPFGVVRGPDGALYVCEAGNHVIRRIAPDGTLSTIAGTGKRGYSGDGGPATKAELNEPYEIRFDRSGNMFFVERLNHIVRRVDAPERPPRDRFRQAGKYVAGAARRECRLPHRYEETDHSSRGWNGGKGIYRKWRPG